MNSIKYPYKLWDAAKHISKARSILSKDVYAEGTDKYRGKKEERISLQGVMGELIAQWYCDTYKPYKNVKFSSLIDVSPQPEPDMILQDGTKIDIKTIMIGDDYCNINVNSHNNPDKKVSWYWCIKLLTETTCAFYFYKHEEIFDWEQKKAYSEYFTKKVV